MQLGSPGIFCVYFRGVAFMNSALTRPGAAAWRVHLAATCVALLLLLILGICSVAMRTLVTDTCGLQHELRAYSLIFVPAAIVVIAGASPYVKARYLSDSANAFFTSLLVQGAWLFALALGLSGSFALPAFLKVSASFGADLPAPTVLVVCLGHWLWLPMGLLGVFSFVQKRVVLSRVWLRWLWAAEACLFSFVWGAMYLPIFVLGCVM
ncbi:MAG: hypothetical protein RJA63_2550 [Pseudomonadota bacterium]|jgi:hypothetical protein